VTRMLKYLKKSWPVLLLVVLMLAVQAMCELALPGYTAKIVNVGIQQQGIESSSPQVIRVKELEALSVYMLSSDYNSKVLPNYEQLPVKEGTMYPLQATEALYKLKNVDEDTRKSLDGIFSQAFLIRMVAEGKIPESMSGMGLGSMPAGALQVLSTLPNLPVQLRDPVLNIAHNQMAAIPEAALIQVSIPYLNAEYQAVGLNAGSLQSNYIFLAGLKMLGVALASMAASVSVGFLGSRISATLGRDLRSRVFSRVVSFSQKEMDRFSTASLITRSTNDIQQVQSVMVFLLRMVIYAPIMGLGGIFQVLRTNVSMTWIIALAVGLLLALVGTLYFVSLPKFKKLQPYIDQLNLVSREILTGLPVIRAFGTEKKEEERFDKANRVLTKTHRFVTRMMSGMMPLMMLIMNGVTLLILWVGAHQISEGAMQVGDIMAFIQYAMQIIMAFLMISFMSIMLPRASVSAKRVDEVILSPLSINDPDSSAEFDADQKGVVRFEDVSFRYPDAKEDMLSHISFAALPGQTTAILGGTGSGKSTLVQLIPRFFDVTGGRITVDGRDVREVSQHNLRDRLGYIPQKGVLFSGTIASNISFGVESATKEDIEKAAAIAQASDFITEKPEGYEDAIAQGGANVSGGQKQRLAIARAILKNPEIFIFDDSFSALDYKTDVTLRTALKRETANSTVIIVAQRISTVLHAEQIIVLDEGKVAGIGNHAELMETCEVYRQIAMSQLSKEELAHAE
jgi:ATP-binding cassette, subfamily B, multidrug efflux pump